MQQLTKRRPALPSVKQDTHVGFRIARAPARNALGVRRWRPLATSVESQFQNRFVRLVKRAMSPDIQYPHAPITEALIDLRVEYAKEMPLEQLKGLGTLIHAAYPHSDTRDFLQAEIQFGPGQSQPGASSTRKTVGYIFHAEDRRQAIQARVDGFTFSRFRPYENWAALKAEAQRLWTNFVSVTSPERVTRIAVRYINRLNLPLKGGQLKFEDYLRTFATIAGDSDQSLEQFFMRLVMPQVDLEARLVLTEALLPQESPDEIGVILDLDLSREGVSFSPQSGEIWDILDRFRERKNQYFEASITDAARELFQ